MAQPLAGGTFWELPGGWAKGPGMNLSFSKLQEFILNVLEGSKTTQALGSTQMSNKFLSGSRCSPCWPQRSQGRPPALSLALTLRLCALATTLTLSFSECSVDDF